MATSVAEPPISEIRRITREYIPRASGRRKRTIDVWRLNKRFGDRPVLSGLTLHVAAGEIFGLIGPSGAGKTTTVHVLCGHLAPTSGIVTVFGQRPSDFTKATRRRIGYMPQNYILYPDLTVKQNVSFAAGIYGIGEWRSRERVRKVLELVELWDARGRTARKISGGMQRRLALAAALVHEPDLLFADEPTAHLDPILRSKLWKHFHNMSARGTTLMLTTQYIDEAEYCDRVGLMFDGALIADGRPEELRRRAFGGDLIDLVFDPPSLRVVDVLSRVPDVVATELLDANAVRVTVTDAGKAIPALLDASEAAGAIVRSLRQARPTFDEVFIRLIEQHGGSRPPVGVLQTSAAGEI